MITADPNREMIDPRKLVEQHGREALAELVARESGYIFQLRPLKDLCLCLKSGMPLLAEGERGGGKTEMVDALAYSCNRPYFELQGMDGLSLHDILFDWDEKGQHNFVVQAVESGALNLEVFSCQRAMVARCRAPKNPLACVSSRSYVLTIPTIRIQSSHTEAAVGLPRPVTAAERFRGAAAGWNPSLPRH